MSRESVEGLVAGDLRIDVDRRGDVLRCDWRGRSVDRDADATLRPFFDKLLAQAQALGASVEMHFEELAGDHREGVAAGQVDEDGREAVLHRGADDVHVAPVVAHREIDGEAEAAHADLSSKSWSPFSNMRSASKLSVCHLMSPA